jgi:hypothetical protein
MIRNQLAALPLIACSAVVATSVHAQRRGRRLFRSKQHRWTLARLCVTAHLGNPDNHRPMCAFAAFTSSFNPDDLSLAASGTINLSLR